MDEVPLHQTFREFTPGHMALLQNEVHVFAVPLFGDAERYAEWLSQDERERAERYVKTAESLQKQHGPFL